MNQANRYPSPDPGNSSHPYHNNQQAIAHDVAQHIQPAPTALMHESGTENNNIPQSFQFIQQYEAQPSTPQQVAQQSLEVNGASTDPAKKRNKVSRACDECRRKKVRCDAESDQPGAQCSNCKRTNQTCQFSRQPQKRGPSKGYIKELADRVSRLEYTPQAHDAHFPVNPSFQHAEGQPYPPQTEYTSNQRKRSHSMVDDQTYDQLQEYARGAASTPDMAYSAPQSAMLPAPVHGLPAVSGDPVQGFAPGFLDGYYKYIHPTIPLLPESLDQLSTILDRSPSETRQAFTAALTAAVKAAETTLHASDLKLVYELFLATKPSRSADSVSDLLRLQTMIFLTLVEELSGPTTSRDSICLGSAVSMANSLHISKPRPSGSENDGLLRRAWLGLIVLDRWHAAAFCGSTLIIDEDVHLDEPDHALLGSPSYHLLRISTALGHLSNIFLRNSPDLASQRPTGRSILQLMKGEVNRLTESIEPLLPKLPLPHLALLHLEVLVEKTTESYYASDKVVIDTALQSVDLLCSKKLSHSPLLHHQVGLVAAVLVQALPVDPQSADPALGRLRQACETCLAPAWREPIISYIDTGLGVHREEWTMKANGAERGGLQHLADAAVGTNRNREDAHTLDWTTILEKGYLDLYK